MTSCWASMLARSFVSVHSLLKFGLALEGRGCEMRNFVQCLREVLNGSIMNAFGNKKEGEIGLRNKDGRFMGALLVTHLIVALSPSKLTDVLFDVDRVQGLGGWLGMMARPHAANAVHRCDRAKFRAAIGIRDSGDRNWVCKRCYVCRASEAKSV